MKSSVLGLLFILSLQSLCSQEITTRIVASDLQTPWEIAWGPDGKIYATGFEGRILRIDPETGAKTVLMEHVSDLKMLGEGGLMGLALAPDFATSKLLYVGYTYPEGDSTYINVVRWRVEGNALVDKKVLIRNIRAWWSHNGCRLVLDDKGYLFITIGDSGTNTEGQNLSSLNGKVLRIHADGGIPTDNPFGNAIWSWGHRNAQGLTMGPNGVLYSSEHGTGTDDEVNIIERGRNYGWPKVEGFCNTNSEKQFCLQANVKEPIGVVWTPTIAPGQLIYYTGDLFPQWKDKLLLIAMKTRQVILLTLDESRTTVTSQRVILADTYGRLRSICQSPDGRVFIGSSNNDRYGDHRDGSDWIVEIRPKTSGLLEDGSDSSCTYSMGSIHIVGGDPRSQCSVYDTLGRKALEQFIDESGNTSISMNGMSVGPWIVQWQKGGVSKAKVILR